MLGTQSQQSNSLCLQIHLQQTFDYVPDGWWINKVIKTFVELRAINFLSQLTDVCVKDIKRIEVVFRGW